MQKRTRARRYWTVSKERKGRRRVPDDLDGNELASDNEDERVAKPLPGEFVGAMLFFASLLMIRT